MNSKQKIFDALNDMDTVREHMKEITRITKQYTIDTPDNESKLDFCNVVRTLADCIEMYIARLEVATESAWKGYYGGKAA